MGRYDRKNKTKQKLEKLEKKNKNPSRGPFGASNDM